MASNLLVRAIYLRSGLMYGLLLRRCLSCPAFGPASSLSALLWCWYFWHVIK
ncbi:hypothetical protein BDR06DRAFT_954012 [Suillus hirtellus]|nr:hypothetical protein BDR06DRAFT_954012 [Suillus hirtellus]